MYLWLDLAFIPSVATCRNGAVSISFEVGFPQLSLPSVPDLSLSPSCPPSLPKNNVCKRPPLLWPLSDPLVSVWFLPSACSSASLSAVGKMFLCHVLCCPFLPSFSAKLINCQCSLLPICLPSVLRPLLGSRHLYFMMLAACIGSTPDTGPLTVLCSR